MANQLDLTSLAQSLGLRYYEEFHLLFGERMGYELSIQRQPEKRIVMLHLGARPKNGEDTVLQPLLEQIKQENPQVGAVVYENYTASVRVNLGEEQTDYQALLAGFANTLAEAAKTHDYIACCASCGKTRDLHRFLQGTEAKKLCPACRAKQEREQAAAWVAKKFPRKSTFRAWIVIAVILLLGATGWLGAYVLGFSAPLLGAVMTVLCFVAYQKMAGRMKKGSIAVLLVLLLLTVFLCHNLCVSFEIMSAVGAKEEANLLGAILFIPSFLKDPLNREVYLLQLGLSLLAVVLSAVPMLYFVYRSWHHKEKLELLEAPE